MLSKNVQHTVLTEHPSTNPRSSEYLRDYNFSIIFRGHWKGPFDNDITFLEYSSFK